MRAADISTANLIIKNQEITNEYYYNSIEELTTTLNFLPVSHSLAQKILILFYFFGLRKKQSDFMHSTSLMQEQQQVTY